MEALIGVAVQYLWPILAGIGLVAAYLFHRVGLIRKGERRMAEKVQREGMDRSIEAHEKAEDIRKKEAERAKDADQPDADYPGGVRRKPPAGKPPTT